MTDWIKTCDQLPGERIWVLGYWPIANDPQSDDTAHDVTMYMNGEWWDSRAATLPAFDCTPMRAPTWWCQLPNPPPSNS